MPGDFGVSNACAVMFTDCLDVSKDRWLVKTEFGCCFIGEYCNVPLSDARLLDFHVVYDKNVFDWSVCNELWCFLRGAGGGRTQHSVTKAFIWFAEMKDRSCYCRTARPKTELSSIWVSHYDNKNWLFVCVSIAPRETNNLSFLLVSHRDINKWLLGNVSVAPREQKWICRWFPHVFCPA